MTLPPSPLELVVSARAARHLRVKPLRAMSVDPAHFLAQWCAELWLQRLNELAQANASGRKQ